MLRLLRSLRHKRPAVRTADEINPHAPASDLVIRLAEAFTSRPGGRYRQDGDFSGEEFRDALLIPALQTGKIVYVVLDGAEGYSGAFLEEAFGGLIRAGFSLSYLRDHFHVANENPLYTPYKMLADIYIQEAKHEAHQQA